MRFIIFSRGIRDTSNMEIGAVDGGGAGSIWGDPVNDESARRRSNTVKGGGTWRNDDRLRGARGD
jgi:hypothetical protein